jgi:hypothetical protein
VTRPWRRLLGGALALAVLVVVLSAVLGGPVDASAMPPVKAAVTTTTYINAPGGIPSMLPLPNTGVAPRDADDRGGWGQYAVFFGILASGVIIFGLVVLESRRKLRVIRRAEGASMAMAQAAATSTRSDPVAETSEKRPDSTARQ